MQVYIGTLLLCLIPGIVAMLVYSVINKRKQNTDKLKEIIFYSVSFMGVISGMKFMVGLGDVTIFESFVELDVSTAIHYLIPLLAMACVIPVVLHLILRDKYKTMIKVGAAFYFLLFAGCLLMTDSISNLVCFALVVVGALTAFVTSLVMKKEITYCNRENWRTRLPYTAISILSWIVMVYVYLPNELFLNNSKEFTVSLANFEVNLLAGALALAVCMIAGGIFLLSEKQWKIYCTVYAAVSVVGYVQTMFLNGKLMSMDGATQTWGIGSIAINAIIWVVLLLAIAILCVKYGERSIKLLRIASVYLILIQLFSFVFLLVTSDTTTDKQYMLTTEERMELSANSNVVVFVLDFFDEQVMERIVEQDEEFLNPMNDFTWYQNATSKYAFTDMSLPYLLTGVEWEKGMLEEDYCDYAYQNSTFLQEIAQKGYDIGIYTDSNLVDSSVKDIVSNFSEGIARKSGIVEVMQTMGKCSRYKIAPFILKNQYHYATSEVRNNIIADDFDENGAEALNIKEHDTLSDVPFGLELGDTGIQIKESDVTGCFKLYHLYGAHPPFVMRESGGWLAEGEEGDIISQSRGCMKIIFEYIKQLKDLGIYDNTTIIITADHGQNYLFDESRTDSLEKYEFALTSSPIMFVKEKKGYHENGLVVSKAPVSHEEIAATIMEAIGGDKEKYGRTIKEIGENEERERVFIYGRYPDLEFLNCTIRGDVMDSSNWQVEPLE